MNEEQIIIVTRGEKAEFDIFLEKENAFPRPVDLTNYEKFAAHFIKEDGDCLSVTEVANANGSSIQKVSPDLLGQLKVILGPNDTSFLKVGYAQDIDIEWDTAAEDSPKRKRLHKALNVEDFCEL